MDKASRKQVGGDHYEKCKIQPKDYIRANNLDFFEGNIVKYITRHKDKEGAKDIRKVIDYAEMILEDVYGYKNGEPPVEVRFDTGEPIYSEPSISLYAKSDLKRLGLTDREAEKLTARNA